MYHISQKLKGVAAYSLTGNGTIIVTESDVSTYDNDQNKIDTMPLEEGGIPIKQTARYNYFSNGFWGNLILIDSSLKITVLKGLYNTANSVYIEEDTIYCLRKEQEEKQAVVIDLHKKEVQIIERLIHPKCFIDQNHYINLLAGNISCYDLNNKLKWQVDLNGYQQNAIADVASVPLISNSQLYVCVITDQVANTVCIDAANGLINWVQPGGGMVWKEHNAVHYAINGKAMHVLQTTENTIRSVPLPFVQNFGGSFPNADFCFIDNTILCNISDKNTALIFDPVTLEVKWQAILSKEQVFTNQPGYQSGKIYILDTGGTLHILNNNIF